MATIQYGLTAQGFIPKQQQVIISEIEADLRNGLGQNINLLPEAVLGQIVNIVSEREALVWQEAEAAYASQSPAGAEGHSVDNILALNSLKRLPALPTRSNPTPLVNADGTIKYGFKCLGLAGTTIPAGSTAQTDAIPPLQFTVDNPITIAAALSSLQSLFLSNAPTTGAFQLAFNGINTPSMPYTILPQSSTMVFASVPVSGMFTLNLTIAGVSTSSPTLNYNASAADIQTALRTMSGFSAITVTGSMGSGFVINWGSVINPILTINTNTTSVSVSFQDSIQALVNALFNGTQYPYTDLTVVSITNGYQFQYGALTPAASQPSSGGQQQPLATVVTSTLFHNTTVTNLNVVMTTQGNPAMGTGSCTCTETGPNYVPAGSIDEVGTSINGWTGVINELDCITGSNIENDTQALVRRDSSLQSKANGPLDSIKEKVSQLPNVTNVIGFQNLFGAALQIISFPIPPTSGKYNLILNAVVTADIQWNASANDVQAALAAVPGYTDIIVTGDIDAGFTIDFNGSQGGQEQDLIQVTGNTTGGSIDITFGRPGHSFEIVVQGGDDLQIAQTILASGPAGIESYGSSHFTIYDTSNNPYVISFSRPIVVPIYVSIVLQTDISQPNAKFIPESVQQIQNDIVTIGGEVSIGGTIIGFGSNGLVGAFNEVQGITNYTIAFGRTPNPTTNTNVQMQPEELPQFETFNVQISYV